MDPTSDQMVQLLTPAGERVGHPGYACDLDEAALRAFYRDLVLLRRFDAEAIALQRQGELAIWASVLGQEAAQVGAGRALAAQDVAFPTYREHGIAWCRGVPPERILALFRGVTNGGWSPDEYGMQVYTIVVGTQALHAAGYAMGIQRDGAVGTGDPRRDTAALALFGDGALSEGDVSEAFTFAAAFNAPVVFLCQNNQWAISVPAERQSRTPLYRRAEGFGFPGVRVDGNDVLACYAVTKAALDRARSGEGPTLVEAYTYRMGAHTTSDDPTRYRAEAELEAWRGRDPITRLRLLLERESLADREFFAGLEAEADALGARLRAACRAMPDPAPSTMFEHVYTEPHPLVEEERAWFEAYQASFASASFEPGGAR
jgi:pyruvate dehydrogenase E1 component alpha subunit